MPSPAPNGRADTDRGPRSPPTATQAWTRERAFRIAPTFPSRATPTLSRLGRNEPGRVPRAPVARAARSGSLGALRAWDGSPVKLAVPREAAEGERRVALVPEAVARLTGGGFEISVERGAGVAAGFADQAYA